MQVPAPAARREGGLPYKWIVACVVIFGTFMSILDSTIVNIAIPRLQSAFGTDLNSVQWVLTAYTLAQGVATPLTAFFADRIGIKRFYILSLIGFTLGSALCGIAWSLPVLILFRIFQGATGAFLTPLAITLLYREFPPQERGTVMGAFGVPILVAPAIGPTIGGYIVTYINWQLIFYINLPIGIVGLLMAFFFLREGEIIRDKHFDIPGFVLSAVGLGLLLYGLSDASTDGWLSGPVLGSLVGGAFLLVIFVAVELSIARRGRQPLLDLSVFADRSFTTSSIASLLVVFSLFGGLFLIPVYLENLRGLSAFNAGLVLLPQAFASMVTMLLGGRLVDRFGVRAIVIPGLIIMSIALWIYSSLDVYIPIGQFQWLLILRSCGIGLCMQPLMVSALANIEPRRLSQASSVSTTLRFVGSSLAIAIIATQVQGQNKIHYAHLAERVTATSPLGKLIVMLQGALMGKGLSATAAYAYALKTIGGLLQRQAYMLAIQDAFRLSFYLAIVAIIATFFVSGAKKKKSAQEEASMSEEERAEAEKAREEASLAV
ncbi:MDR family MFS transporter [Ktedonobacter racemifer]|uniref:Drug resistance transporter, EmrB/QacA subfamily n=1 Tax=Ktedonobacter racemifer DSM 44963 TaxID=485913 RepID=D6TRE1_KTERA|nr:MDR family MFS transporter [Ktedonobacter racemifer]EFH87840.1 drug resistance transporter, EmrB/QacA subfamily [Ktedonobacter racemifer DSM 44963]